MIINKANKKDKFSLVKYLDSVQNDFTPPLFDRIKDRSSVVTIEDYVEKILASGTVLYTQDLENISGIIVIYHNNLEKKQGYIPLLSVKKEYSGRGIAKLLVNAAVDLAFESGMNEIFVKTWVDNHAAKNIYQNLGFIIINTDKDLLFKKSST